ncbi:hypothetical protein OXB_0580 [Bacillus sp. OxB-1]|uniref:hypothetical protein n=1 Tax=Bacillus sp. (strain OxB-1) TaxID=98228 RepID=UPI000581CD1D|nr:hypothetical protein [Bacillus sp. OxB-1]BAQ09052.1 hypothetical protein OXB_0580 [Bacillus sp. OxB-1]
MRRRNPLLFAVVLLVGAVILFWMREKPLNGNDAESIGRILLEQEQHGDVSILEIKDVEEYRVVTYLHNDTDQALTMFRKDAKGNYEWVRSEKQTGEPLAIFNTGLHMDVQEGPSFIFVTNPENQVAAVQVEVNGFSEKIELSVGEAAVKWLDIPKSGEGQYAFTFTYFDQDGNEIEEMGNG